MRFLSANGIDAIVYDHYLFSSFLSQPNSWVMKNYAVDESREVMAPAAKHYDIKRYLIHHKDQQVTAGISFNFNWKETFQIESMGFLPSHKEFSFEILNFYICKVPSRNPIRLLRAAMSLIDHYLENRYRRVYATCVPELFNFYAFVGWKALTKIELDRNRFLFVIQYTGANNLGLDLEAV